MARTAWRIQLIESLLFSSIWIACCAEALCYESVWILQTPLPSWPILLFVGAATFCHYNLHYYLRSRHETSNRDRWSERHRSWFLPAILLGGLVAASCLTWFTSTELTVIVITGAISLLYSLPLLPRGYRLKQLGILKPFILAAVWSVTTVWLPAHEAPPLLLTLVLARRFVFMLVLCLAFDVRDQAKDTLQGIRTIPVLCGARFTYRLIDGLLILFALFALLVEWHLHRPQMLAALWLSALITKGAIVATHRYTSEVYYLGVVDGMMALQAMLVGLATFIG